MDLLFGFEGRIGRGKYWLTGFSLILVIIFAIMFAVRVAAALDDPGDVNSTAMFVIGGGLTALLVYSSAALMVKRLHDRDKSGWWALFYSGVPTLFSAADQFNTSAGGVTGDLSGTQIAFALIGSAISIWATIELGFFRGTDGPNRFGVDPLGDSTWSAADRIPRLKS